jgi:hypothetical protein
MTPNVGLAPGEGEGRQCYYGGLARGLVFEGSPADSRMGA